MTRDQRGTKGGVVGVASRLVEHSRVTRRVMLAGVLVSLVVLVVMLVTVASGLAVTVFVALLLLSCLASCVIVWRISEHDAAALELAVKGIRDRAKPCA